MTPRPRRAPQRRSDCFHRAAFALLIWAYANPVRKVYYNLTITALSITVALGIASIELVGILHEQLHTTDVPPRSPTRTAW